MRRAHSSANSDDTESARLIRRIVSASSCAQLITRILPQDSAAADSGLVYLHEDPAAIMKKFKRAVTDSDSEVRYDRENKPGVSNLLEILSACTGETPEALADKYTQYGPLKGDTGEAVVELLRPIQARYHELMTDRGELQSLLRKGAAKAGAVAAATLDRAKRNLGLLPA